MLILAKIIRLEVIFYIIHFIEKMSRRESVIAGGGSDPRKAYLFKVASHILSLNLSEERLPNVAALNAFCNSDVPILAISRLDQLNINKSTILRVIFYKLRNRPLSLDDFKQNVSVLSMQENAGETLLGTLKQVFSRVLPNEAGVDARGQIANLVGELEESLQSNFGENGHGEDGGSVHSLRSEIEHWQRRAHKGNEQAQMYAEAMEPLAEKLATIEGDGQLDELYEMLEIAEQSVDALWNILDDPYPQRRMRQLLICIGESLCAAIVRRLSLEQLFRSSENLRLAVFLTVQWRETVELLTSKSWPQNGLHPWEGPPLKMDQLEKFNKRMDEAYSLATLAEQIGQLIADQQGEADSTSQIQRAIESTMAKANPFEFGPHTEQQWQNRLNATERVLDPYIERIMPNLREKLQPSVEENGQIIVDELHRYRHFLGRKQVKEKLQAERQTLIGRLSELLVSLRRGMEKLQQSTNIPTGRFLTEIAAKISWIRGTLTRTEKMRKIAAIFFDDLPAYPSFEHQIRTLTQELKQAEEEQFDAWCRDMIAHVDDQNGDSISLQTTGRLMILERARGILNVSYSDRLARLLREVAQLQAMGFRMPSKILQCAKQGERFYQYGVLLKQVAHFYNTIEQQMLPCQQAMLLDEAMTFERLVVPPTAMGGKQLRSDERETMNLTWENPDKLKAYIDKLREAAFKLTSHNRRLRKAHSEIEQLVLALGQTDLLREEEKWTAKLLEIRQKFVDEERFVAVKANMQPWVNHWNRQLYKVVQLQFRWALENLQSQLPSMNAQLVFRDQKLQLRPPLEELKQNYYKSLRKLLSIPQRLRGVQNSQQESEMFARIVMRNFRRFHPLYEQSEQMFERLARIGEQFDEWTALAQVNLEDLLEQNLQNPADWEEQIRLLRLKQREAERMPNEIRIECVRVSTNGVRSLVDDLLKRFHDALAWTLRHSIRSELQAIEQKLSQGIEKLSTLPQSLDEVAEANQTQLTLARSSAQIRSRMSLIEEKDQLLRSLFGSEQSVGGVQSIRDQFMQFLSLLETHELVMREQVQTMKANVGQSVKSLAEELTKLHSLWNQFKPKSEIFTSQDDRLALVRAMEFIREKRQEFDKLTKKLDKVRLECEQFEIEQPEWAGLAELREDLEQYESNYLLYEDFSNELQPLADQEWVLFRSKTYLFDEFLQHWMDKLKATTGSSVAVRLQKDIEQMKEFSNCLKFCRGEIFGADHWLEMFRLLGLPRGTSLEKLTFGSLLLVQQKVVINLEKLKELNARAHGEISIREAIQELEMWAAQAEFALTDYKHSNGSSMKIVKEWKPVLNQVRDNQALLQSLQSSPYYSQFREQIQLWEKKVADLEQNLHHLNEIQRKWVYLEPIFGRGSLPSEAARFNRIDAEFRAILGDIAKDNRIASLRAALGQTLEQLVDQLNRCQRALNEFLEEKRNAFPRFYFLGDDDLLEIVGQSTNPAVIQSHLKKLYQGINRVAFDGQQQSIRAMISAEGEQIQLLKPVQIVPKVEQWLAALSDEMRSTLRRLVVDCLQERALDPSRYPSQVLCLSEEIRFCSDVEKCLASLGGSPTEQLVAYRRQLSGQLERLSNTQIDESIVQLKLKALILDLIHHIAVLDQLIGAENNQSIGCWTWQRQLRFYLVSGLVVVRQAEYEFPYTYEYQGNAQKLVHTPLTDKCYLTLTQALAMGLGGNPYGPAGTGKTESVKALAGLMGRQVLVFNCDEGIDVQAIGRIFVGLIQCGAWGCFDEFNRLAKGVLSAVSGQVQIIQEAVRIRAANCRIGDHTVPVDTNSAIFVTMNPAGKGYGGRQRLPDNLKQLFRPVAMSVPDNEQIAETLLFAEGFTQAKALAKKLVTTFALAKEMLSTQQHYDWGLRSLKTVLKGCSDAIAKKRQELAAKGQKHQKLTGAEEFELVLQNLQLNTLSKLTFADARRFKVLLEDIFPEMPKQAMQFNELRPHLQKAAQQLQLAAITDVQMNKLFELYEQLRQRIGVIIVGPPGSGKSTLWRLLKIALSSIGGDQGAVDVFSMNPKSMPRARLLGHLEPDTREWADGTLTLASRMVTTNPAKPAWIVCDGDIDPEWIEALNSVLDDNRLLTIPSGERIQFGPNVNFLFECVNLVHASPATISRMGMILVSNEDLDLPELIKNFLLQNEKNVPAQFPDWINSTLMPALDWAFAHQNREFSCSQVGIIKNALSLIKTAKTRNQFLVNTFRALLPYVEPDSRRELSERVIFSGAHLPDPKASLNVYCDPRTDSLLAYTDDIGLPFTQEEMRKTRPVVLTARMQLARDILLEWLSPTNRQHILIVGPDGCGKECLLRNCFEGATTLSVRRKLVTMHCGAHTNSMHLEQLLMEHCVQVSGSNGRAFKPKEDDQLVLHLKSANLSSLDAYGTSMLVAFLEQMLDYNGFYDRHLEWIGLENVQLILSISTATGNERFTLPERFASKLRVLCLDAPLESELRVIYGAYLLPILGQNTKNRSKTESLAANMANMFTELAKAFSASDQFHYVFTSIDLTNWAYALMRYERNPDLDLNNCLHFEAQRIFGDRLISAEHRSRFQSILQDHFPIRDRLLFCPGFGPVLAKENVANGGKPMQPIKKADYSAQLEKSMNRLKTEQTSPEQPLNDAFVEMCLAVDRALTAPAGSVLLAGRVGMGRRAAVTLVAQIHQMRLFTLRVSSAYSLRNFAQDLKDSIHSACVDGEQVVLLVEDYQLMDEAFLQFISSLVASGNIPGLYTNPQELDQLLVRLRDSAMDEGFDGNGLHDFFAHKVHQNVHVALLMNTGHPQFVSRILSNPPLYKHCNIIWQETWSPEIATQIAAMALRQKGMEEPGQWLLSSFVQFYQRAPWECRIPAKFAIFVTNFHELMETKKSTIEKRLQRLKAGVDKLTETRTAVAKLQKKAAKKSKLLAEKQAEANSALGEITRSMTGATEQKADMEQLKSATEAENVKIEEQKKIIEKQLSEVEPLLRAAREAVGSIKTESITEVRSLRAPPEAIRDILQAVLLFMGILDASWEAMRKFLAKSGVKDEIINFDARRITPDMAKKVGALVRAKAASFDPKNAKRASAAAAPLAAWVTANLQYAVIIEKIAPLEQKKDTLVKNLTAAERQMDQLSKGLKTLDKKVDELKAKFEASMKEATEIKIDLDREEATIVVAGKLVERLGGEYARWQEHMKQLEAEMRTAENCCLIGAAFMTFLGGATEEIRLATMKEWAGLCQLPEAFDLLAFLATETEQLGWKAEGMPSNRLALENAAILFRTKETPFIIDPSGAISAFLLNHFQKSPSIELLRAGQPDLMTQIELAVRFGKILIIDEVDAVIEPALIPLLRKEFKSIGTRLAVQLGEKQVDFNEQFRLFLCTRNEHCRLAEHARGALCEINFSITRSGFASQLLGLAIQLEKPELERNSAQLSSQMESLKLQLDQIEQTLLEELAVSTGSLLENTGLLESLNESKEKADKVSEGLAQSQQLRAQIDSQRDAFLPFAQRCAQLYFAIRPLHAIKQCYQFSVNDCIALFRKFFVGSGEMRTGEEKDRLERTYRRLRIRLFEFISRSLFKEDRLIFAMQYVHETAQSGQFGRNEWELFTGMFHQTNDSSNALISQIGWLGREKKLAVEKIQSNLPALFQAMQIGDQQTWAGFMKSTECENAYPPSVVSKLSDFQRVLILQALRPDRLHSGIIRFASKILGIESLNAPNLNFVSMHRDESSASQPILLLIAPGSSVDPSAELAEYAQKHFGGHQKFHQMSLGQQGSEWTVLDLLRKCTRNGDWLCLHNVHLVPTMAAKLLTEIGQAEKERQLNGEFRLWLTAEPDEHLPVVFLQTCLKATYETPPGIRKNLERNYIGQAGNEAERNVPKLKAIFLLHWLNAVAQERRNFIPQSWLKFYEFSGADLRAAKHSLDSQFAIKEKANLRSMDWKQFRGLMMNAIYGGRIEIELDNRVLMAFLMELFNTEMVDGSGGELANGLKMPMFELYSEYCKWIESTLPVNDRAELLALPRNIMLSWDMAQSGNVVAKLRVLNTASAISSKSSNPQSGQQNAFNRQLWTDSLNPLLNLWKRLNQQHPELLQTAQKQRSNRPISAASQQGKRESLGNINRAGDDPLTEILQLEFIYSLNLMQFIHSSLSAISRAIKGNQLPEKKTIEMAQSLLQFQIPTAWDSLWAGPQLPTQYLEALIYKVKSTQTLLISAQSKQLFNSKINLAQLFRPGTLLNAFRQYSARKMKKSMDALQLATAWHVDGQMPAQAAQNAPTLTLCSLRIQGALFDGKELRAVTPSASPFSEIPNLNIFWADEEQKEKEGENWLSLPLFADTDRRELILQIAVPCPEKQKNSWILAGVALFLNAD